ncbi:MAG: Bug family tripartite tricarboxylate transporter substrate binding protein [Bilophila wadsworthia]
MKKSIIASLLIACSLFIGGNTDARAEYPYDKPINIIVPFGPGGGVDIAARILADYFQQNYNITINVVNKPGGAQAIGINEMLRARPDGYTLAFPGFSALATTPKLTNVGYTLKNIKPVAHIASMECAEHQQELRHRHVGKIPPGRGKEPPMGPSTGLPAPSPRNACT